jgi:hypothetical protein
MTKADAIEHQRCVTVVAEPLVTEGDRLAETAGRAV